MENKNSNSGGRNLKIPLLMCLMALVFIILAVNLLGFGGAGGKVKKAFREAFDAENSLTDSYYAAYPFVNKERELSSGSTKSKVTGQIYSVGDNSENLFTKILKGVSLDMETTGDAQNKSFNNNVKVLYNSKDLLDIDVISQGEKIAFTVPDVLNKYYSIDKSDIPGDDPFMLVAGKNGMSLENIVGVSLMDANRMGRSGAEGFLTFLKLGKFTENEDGTVDVLVEGEKANKSLGILLKAVPDEKWESIPVLKEGLSVSDINMLVTLNEDKSLSSSELNCTVTYSLKDSPEEEKNADVKISFARNEATAASVSLYLTEKDVLTFKIERKADAESHRVKAEAIVVSETEGNAFSYERTLTNAEDSNSSVILRAVRSGEKENSGIGLALNSKITSDEETLSETDGRATLLFLDDVKFVPLGEAEYERNMEPAAENIVMPESEPFNELSEDEQEEIRNSVGMNAAKKVLASILKK